MEWMTEALKYISGLVLGGGGAWSAIKLWADRNKTPLDRRAVEVATQGGQVKMSLDLAAGAIAQVQQLREEMKDMQEQFDRLEEKANQANRRADEYERKAARAERALEELIRWATDLLEHWDEYRLSARPPRLPYIVAILKNTADKTVDSPKAE